MNVIPGRGQFSKAEIAALFAIHICDYRFSINELYKRYTMRDPQALQGRKASDINCGHYQKKNYKVLNIF